MNIDRLFECPDYFLVAFDGDEAIFLEMDRAAYNRTVFCDQRILPKSQARIRVPWSALLERCSAISNGAAAPGIILHMAHCGSTLLARAMDIVGETVVYREPYALRQLGVEAGGSYFGSLPPSEWADRLNIVMALLSRSYRRSELAITKANVPVNFMLPGLCKSTPSARMIALHFQLEDYVLAILRPPGRKKWLANVSVQLRRGIDALTPPAATGDDGQAVARLWLAQMRLFGDLLDSNENALSLDANSLFADPGVVIKRAFEQFDHPLTDAQVEAVTASELFSRYSKDSSIAFSNATRLRRRDEARVALANELSSARAYVKDAGFDDVVKLPRPLLGDLV